MSDPGTTGPILRVSERCPSCRAELVLREVENGAPVIECNSCSFSEMYDKRGDRLMRRLLFLQRELTKRDPDAQLWEETT